MAHLGIDIGTTKVSAVVAFRDAADPAIAAADHHAALSRPDGFFEQDFERIDAAVRDVLARLPHAALRNVSSIGISTQMHSILLGRRHGVISACVTWQDRRAEDLLPELRRASGRPLQAGYGAVTLAWYARRGELDGWEWAATPGDELARRLVGADRVSIQDATLAAAWGVYDPARNAWDDAALTALGIPDRLLPSIGPSGTCVGHTRGGFGGLPDGIPVYLPIGDNQASVLGSGGDPDTDLFVTVGTGSQLSAVLSAEAAARPPATPGLDLRPFPGGRILVAVAPLSGGRAWSLFAEAVAGLFAAFGAPPPDGNLLDRLSDLAERAAPDAGGLRIAPDFFGSRLRPGSFGEITGITPSNFTLPNIAWALALGIVDNLFVPMPATLLRARRHLVGSGNGLVKCAALRRALQARCDLPLVLPRVREEAATGAALFAASSAKSD